MSNSNNQSENKKYQKQKTIDIHDRIYKFVTRVIELTKALPKTSQNLVLINQVMRSATSMGANDQEADGSITKKDFIHCLTTVRKESKETNYWLTLIADTNLSIKPRMNAILQENKEIIKIISSIITNTKSKM
ncbi:MAG: four helix bundle protein [Patescibacteria group bacterium]|nr:four helix bundle protein [Patescibacteria group bacterium]MCL5095673.1 four helix bundle protein [Patescibacteria group bacterium]